MVRSPNRRPGYVLVAVLLVVVVLSLASYRYLAAMTSEAIVAQRTTEQAQVRAYAISGVYDAMAKISDPNTFLNTLAGNPTNAPTAFTNVAVGNGDESSYRGAGQFSLMYAAAAPDGSGITVYNGAADEQGKLNINTLIKLDPTGEVLYAALMLLPNMTEDVADAIVDWVDADDTPRTSGAESDYYAGLTPPYQAKNGPLNSIDELLLVKGVTPQLLYGNDRNRNGRLDPGEEDGNDLNQGWSAFLTVYGREVNADSDGNARVFLQDTDMSTNYEALTDALGQEMADYVMAYRLFTTSSTATTTLSATSSGSSSSGGMTIVITTTSKTSSNKTTTATPDQVTDAVQNALALGTAKEKNKISSVLSLVNTQVTLPKASGAGPNTPDVVVACPLNDPAKMQQYLPLLLDKTTTTSGGEMVPRINVNTAPQEVLMALPGVSPTDVQNALAIRSGLDMTSLEARTGAWLVTQAQMSPTVFQTLEKYISGRSSVYRLQSLGYFANSGPVARVEAVIDTSPGAPRILYFRDLTDLGGGFDPPR
ncbi:MAG TPA: hypothetical protein VGJ05_14315 [Fimbriiglobus sp.]|jgi:type II secretory pathway component PulK